LVEIKELVHTKDAADQSRVSQRRDNFLKRVLGVNQLPFMLGVNLPISSTLEMERG